MPRRGKIAKRDVLEDPIYNSKLVTRLINNVMVDGKKGVAQKIVYGAFEIVNEKTGKDALEAFKEALEARLVRRQCRRHEADKQRQHQQQGQKPFFHVLSSQNKKILPAGNGGQVQQNRPNEIPSFSHATSGSGRNACSLRVF